MIIFLGNPKDDQLVRVLISMMCPHQVGVDPDFGDDIERWALRLLDAITAGRTVQSVSASWSATFV